MWKVLRLLWAEPWLCLYSFPSWILLLFVTEIEQKRCWFTALNQLCLFSFSPPRTWGEFVNVCELPFDSSRQDGSAGDLLQWMAKRAACEFAEWDADLCWCPVKPVFVSAHLSKSTWLFHCGGKKNQQGNAGRYFLPAGAADSLLLIELLIDYLRAAIKID